MLSFITNNEIINLINIKSVYELNYLCNNIESKILLLKNFDFLLSNSCKISNLKTLIFENYNQDNIESIIPTIKMKELSINLINKYNILQCNLSNEYISRLHVLNSTVSFNSLQNFPKLTYINLANVNIKNFTNINKNISKLILNKVYIIEVTSNIANNRDSAINSNASITIDANHSISFTSDNTRYLNSNRIILQLFNLTVLKITKSKLIHVTINLPNLKYLDLSYNKISEIQLSHLINIQKLDLSYNNFTKLDLNNLTKLSSLNLTGNILMQLNIDNIDNLTYLNFDFNNNLINTQIPNLSNLRTLNIKTNEEITESNKTIFYNHLNIENLVNLTRLKLSYNDLESFNFSNMSNLIKLDLSNNKFQEINLLCDSLINLEKLDITYNKLKYIDISKLVNLKSLDLSYNNLQYIDLSKNTNLKYINMSYNNLINIDIRNLINLRSLILTKNSLVDIKLNNNLSNLTFLDLNDNKLNNINLFSDCFKNIEYLFLDSNNLNEVDLTRLVNLKCLYIFDNEFSSGQFSNIKLNYQYRRYLFR